MPLTPHRDNPSPPDHIDQVEIDDETTRQKKIDRRRRGKAEAIIAGRIPPDPHEVARQTIAAFEATLDFPEGHELDRAGVWELLLGYQDSPKVQALLSFAGDLDPLLLRVARARVERLPISAPTATALVSTLGALVDQAKAWKELQKVDDEKPEEVPG